MAAVMKSSEKSPCTNHLIEWPLQCGVVAWTYNLTAHYQGSYHNLSSLCNSPVFYRSETKFGYFSLITSYKRHFAQENQYLMPSKPTAEGEHASSDSEPDEENPRAPARRVPRRVADDSDSDSIHSYDAEDSIDIKQEYIDVPLLSDDDDELEFQ
jgi:hypothetical protein